MAWQTIVGFFRAELQKEHIPIEDRLVVISAIYDAAMIKNPYEWRIVYGYAEILANIGKLESARIIIYEALSHWRQNTPVTIDTLPGILLDENTITNYSNNLNVFNEQHIQSLLKSWYKFELMGGASIDELRQIDTLSAQSNLTSPIALLTTNIEPSPYNSFTGEEIINLFRSGFTSKKYLSSLLNNTKGNDKFPKQIGGKELLSTINAVTASLLPPVHNATNLITSNTNTKLAAPTPSATPTIPVTTTVLSPLLDNSTAAPGGTSAAPGGTSAAPVVLGGSPPAPGGSSTAAATLFAAPVNSPVSTANSTSQNAVAEAQINIGAPNTPITGLTTPAISSATSSALTASTIKTASGPKLTATMVSNSNPIVSTTSHTITTSSGHTITIGGVPTTINNASSNININSNTSTSSGVNKSTIISGTIKKKTPSTNASNASSSSLQKVTSTPIVRPNIANLIDFRSSSKEIDEIPKDSLPPIIRTFLSLMPSLSCLESDLHAPGLNADLADRALALLSQVKLSHV